MDEKYRQNVLILDPERDTAELFARALESSHGCKCYWVSSTPEAKSLLLEIPFHFLLADVSLLLKDHFMLLETIRNAGGGTTVLVGAYLNEKENVKKALEKGARGYFIKPIMVGSLRKLIDDFAPRQGS